HSCGKRITSSGTRFIRYHASSGDRGLSAPAPLSLSVTAILVASVGKGGAQQPSGATPPDSAVVVGTVYDTLSGAPLRLVSVRVLETGRSVLTDDAGRYRLTGPPGELHLTVRQLGYEPASLAVTAPPGGRRQDVH